MGKLGRGKVVAVALDFERKDKKDEKTTEVPPKSTDDKIRQEVKMKRKTKKTKATTTSQNQQTAAHATKANEGTDKKIETEATEPRGVKRPIEYVDLAAELELEEMIENRIRSGQPTDCFDVFIMVALHERLGLLGNSDINSV